ncbi:hypothetical protein Goklo_017341 [Gossypium klotzschianum]|uniref:Uncharacterized protein n=1 Tax=Gossypium klotzschianum TaxID=34286 RepID=A0A7J8UHR6_9ROSI|nr:hypothetical protein [Gossypium klotzschianum]
MSWVLAIGEDNYYDMERHADHLEGRGFLLKMASNAAARMFGHLKATEDFDIKYCFGTFDYGSVYRVVLPGGKVVALEKLSAKDLHMCTPLGLSVMLYSPILISSPFLESSTNLESTSNLGSSPVVHNDHLTTNMAPYLFSFLLVEMVNY